MTIIYVAICFLMLYSIVLTLLFFKLQKELKCHIESSWIDKEKITCRTLKCEKILVSCNVNSKENIIKPYVLIEADFDDSCITMNSLNKKSSIEISCNKYQPGISIKEQSYTVKACKKEGDE